MGKVPETSVEAFKSLDLEKLTETKRKILYALSQLITGSHEDVAAYLKVERSIVWKRMSELERDGLIFKPGTKKALRSGKLGFEYSLTDKSVPKTTASERALKGRSIADISRKITSIAKSVQGGLFPQTGK
jgi:DNA-binding Lrp family transcriptional regulator